MRGGYKDRRERGDGRMVDTETEGAGVKGTVRKQRQKRAAGVGHSGDTETGRGLPGGGGSENKKKN